MKKRMPLKRNSDSSKNGKPKLNRWFMERKADFSQNIKRQIENRKTKKVKGKSKKSNIRIMGVLQKRMIKEKNVQLIK